MKILQRDSLTRGGFAGLRETRLVVDKIGMNAKPDVQKGIGNFVYLADARYLPHGETKMHSHREIDIVTVLLEGNLEHEGSLEHGQSLTTPQVQVQRAGGEGFSHNEINPDQTRTRLLQIWLIPENENSAAAYKLYNLSQNEMIRVYGGSLNQQETFDSSSVVEIGLLKKGKTVEHKGEYILYVVNGQISINEQTCQDGDLIRGSDLKLTVISNEVHLSLFYVE